MTYSYGFALLLIMTTSIKDRSVLIPYRVRPDGQFEVYLQQRDDMGPFPDQIGFFGGGIEEGETPEQAIVRETQEELCFALPDGLAPIKVTNVPGYEFNVFMLPVGNTFETSVKVMEGRGGMFLSEQEISAHTNIISHDQKILLELIDQLPRQ